VAINFNSKGKHSEAMAQDPYAYYRMMYGFMQNFSEYSLRNSFDGMFSSIRELATITACRFKEAEYKAVWAKIDALDHLMKPKAPTKQAMIENEREKFKKAKELRLIYRELVMYINRYNMLIPTFVKDFRDAIVRSN